MATAGFSMSDLIAEVTGILLSLRAKSLTPEIDGQIRSLEQNVAVMKEKNKEIQERNQELNNALKMKDKEIDGLKNSKIKELENRASKLETEKEKLKQEVQALKAKVTELKGELEYVKANALELAAELEEVKGQNNTLRESLGNLKTDNTTIQKSNDSLERKVEHLERKVEDLEKKSRESDDGLILGELCRRVQSMIYKKILPSDLYDDRESYKISNDMKKSLGELFDGDEHKINKAYQAWTELQGELKWDEGDVKRIVSKMKTIQTGRNVVAHPKLTYDILRESTQRMKDKLASRTHVFVTGLIDVWKQLEEMA